MGEVKPTNHHQKPLPSSRERQRSPGGTAETKQISPASPAPSGSIMSSKLPWHRGMNPMRNNETCGGYEPLKKVDFT